MSEVDHFGRKKCKCKYANSILFCMIVVHKSGMVINLFIGSGQLDEGIQNSVVSCARIVT